MAAPACLLAQNQGPATASPVSKNAPPTPFSRLGLSVGIGAGGINMQAAVEASRHLNIRGVGNYFSYTVNNVKISGNGGSNGVDVSGNINLATGGAYLDYYPWPNHGFRLSPGLVFYNQNQISASGTAPAGASITLGPTKYYADSVDPFALNPKVTFNTHEQAFSATAGFGNLISRKGGHFSVPFEIGAVFTGAPAIALNITGNGCTNSADTATNGPSCVNMATDPTAQSNIAAQTAKYQNDLNVLKVYPVFSIGFGFNFSIH